MASSGTVATTDLEHTTHSLKTDRSTNYHTGTPQIATCVCVWSHTMQRSELLARGFVLVAGAASTSISCCTLLGSIICSHHLPPLSCAEFNHPYRSRPSGIQSPAREAAEAKHAAQRYFRVTKLNYPESQIFEATSASARGYPPFIRDH